MKEKIFTVIRGTLLFFGMIGIFLSGGVGLYEMFTGAAVAITLPDQIDPYLVFCMFIGTIYTYYRIIQWWGEHHHIKKTKEELRAEEKFPTI